MSGDEKPSNSNSSNSGSGSSSSSGGGQSKPRITIASDITQARNYSDTGDRISDRKKPKDK